MENPDDFVCATGISHSVQDLVEYVFEKLELDWKKLVGVNPRYLRPEELYNLRGDSTKLSKATGWKPVYSFETMLDEMIEFWLEELK
jgi:GDPmannose 4,6-dehydratase